MMILTEILLVVVLSILIYKLFYKKESRSLRFIKSFPGPKILPFIGQFWALPAPHVLLKTAVEIQEKYGTRMPLIAGPLQLLWLTHPDDVGKVLASKENTTDKFWLYSVIFTEWLGTSLFNKLAMKTMNSSENAGKEYFTKRKIIMPAFNFGILENFSHIFNRNSEFLVEILKSKEAKGEVIEIHHLLNLCALDIICESATGESFNCMEKLDHEFPIAHIKEFQYLLKRAFSPWLWPEMLWKLSPTGRREKANRGILNGFVEKIIHERRGRILKDGPLLQSARGPLLEDSAERSSVKKRVFLDLLIDEQQRGELKLSDQDIRDETSFFIFAGHDTSASTLTWAVYLLAKNPAEQDKLHLELDSEFRDDRARNVEASDLSNLKYLDCCIKETLRLYPPAAFFGRRIEKDCVLDDKTTIPEGTDVLLLPWLTHRLPEFYPEPEEFRPSRFLPENSTGRHPFAFIPFSGGPRNCMGQKYASAEIKTILAHVFRNFRIELSSPMESVVPILKGVVAPLNGLHVKLFAR